MTIRSVYIVSFLFINPFVGCGFGYYLHLLRGQISVVTNVIEVDDYRASTNDSSIVGKLAIVDSLLLFAKQIGLNTEKNYQSYFDTRGRPISWNISASRPDTFKSYLWTFPIVGSLPYKGFFDKNRAEKEYLLLKNLNYDVHLSPVSAYSTLGYFSDPLLSTMLNLKVGSLSELLFHELTHSTVYLEDMTDFNESFASFVGVKATEEFLNRQFGPNSEYLNEFFKSLDDSKRFRSFMEIVVSRLDSLYSSQSSREAKIYKRNLIFNEEKFRFSEELGEYNNSNYKIFLEWDVNNARLLSYKRYNSSMPNFESVYKTFDKSIAKMISLVVACSKMKVPVYCLKENFNFNQ